MSFITSGGYNVAIGSYAMWFSTDCSNNVAVGGGALSSHVHGADDVAVGYAALANPQQEQGNTAIGSHALQKNVNDSQLVAIGYQALQNDNAAGQATASGFGENTAVGYQALQSDTVGTDNTALGYQALLVSTTSGGNQNTAIGARALINLGSELGFALNNGGGTNNIAIGCFAGVTLLSGNNDIYIGNGGPTTATAGGYTEYNTIRIGDPTIQTATYLAGTVYANGVALTSDRNAKENFQPVDNQAVLAKVAALPVTQWNYKTDKAGVQHIGPMAQDFQAAFKLDGNDDKHISVVDEGGVALAAIQGLNEKVEGRSQKAEASIEELKAENAALKQRLEALEKIILNQKPN
jgi:hypothetical protein